MTSLQCPSPSVAAMLAQLGGGLIARSGIGSSGVRPMAAALAAAASELDPRPPWSPTAARRALTELHASVMVADGALDEHGAVGGGGGTGVSSSAAASGTATNLSSSSSSSSRAYDAGACRSWLAAAQAFVLALQTLLLQCSAATATPDQALVFAAAAGDLRRAAAALATAGAPAVATVSLATAAALSAKGQGGGGFGFGAPPGMLPRNVVSISCFGNGTGGFPAGAVLPPTPGGGDGARERRLRQQQQEQQPFALQQPSASGARLVAQRPVRPYEWYARKPAL